MPIDYDTLFCFVDDFCKGFEPWYKRQLIAGDFVKGRDRAGHLQLSEMLTILLAFPQSGMVCFKYFYLYNRPFLKQLFPQLVHYARFVKLIKRAFPALICLFKSLEGKVTEYLFIDSTPMPVCHNLREKKHKVFKDVAAKGKTSTGWFYGMKLHFIINTNGEIVRLMITPGNVNDRVPVTDMVKGITAKLIGDKGYISQDLLQNLLKQGITLITKIKKNMKNHLMDITDKIMLMKRSFIETVFSSIKSLGILIHTRYRCPINAFCHILAGLISYQIRTDKPNLELSQIKQTS